MATSCPLGAITFPLGLHVPSRVLSKSEEEKDIQVQLCVSTRKTVPIKEH